MARQLSALYILLCYGSASSSAPQADTECGPVRGVLDGRVSVFKGIPYAAPPTGHRRWRAPESLVDAGLCWNRTLPATDFGAVCPQSPGAIDIGKQDESCLFLNVWTPSAARDLSASRKPVMVWLHGGGYVFGSGNYPNYMPTSEMAVDMDVVLVSLNYRLGAFGWLATKELSSSSPTNSSGNYGYQDMIAALRFVKKNIGQFGGDPNRVTLYGQSAGGTATMALMAAPAAQGLFHRVWMQSGSARYETTLQEAERANAYFISNIGCTGRGVACLRAASTEAIVNATAWTSYPGWAGNGVSGFPIPGFSWGNLAIVDGHIIPKPPVQMLASAERPSVPLIIGTTAQETDIFPLMDVRNYSWEQYSRLAQHKMRPFGNDVVEGTLRLYPNTVSPEYQYTSLSSDIGVTCPNTVIARQIAAGWKSQIYRYVFTARPSHPMHMFGTYPGRYAFHTLDSIYLFNTTKGAMQSVRPDAKPTSDDFKVTQRLRAEIGAFVRTGECPNWEAFPKASMLLGDSGVETKLMTDYHEEECNFWEPRFFNYSWAGN